MNKWLALEDDIEGPTKEFDRINMDEIERFTYRPGGQGKKTSRTIVTKGWWIFKWWTWEDVEEDVTYRPQIRLHFKSGTYMDISFISHSSYENILETISNYLETEPGETEDVESW